MIDAIMTGYCEDCMRPTDEDTHGLIVLHDIFFILVSKVILHEFASRVHVQMTLDYTILVG